MKLGPGHRRLKTSLIVSLFDVIVAWDRSELERRQYRISSSHYDASMSVSMQDTVIEQDLPDSAGNQQVLYRG